MRRFIAFLIAVLSLLLASCATSSAGYVEDAKTFAVTRGSIVSVRNLTSGSHQRLSDGVVITIAGSGAEVDMKLGEQMQTITLSPGWQLLFTGDQDYVLQPYRAPAPQKTEAPAPPEEPAKTEAAAPPETSAKTEAPAPPPK